jgi:hypothetical protein
MFQHQFQKNSEETQNKSFNRKIFQQQSISQTFAAIIKLFLSLLLAAGTLFSCPDKGYKCYLVAC